MSLTASQSKCSPPLSTAQALTVIAATRLFNAPLAIRTPPGRPNDPQLTSLFFSLLQPGIGPIVEKDKKSLATKNYLFEFKFHPRSISLTCNHI